MREYVARFSDSWWVREIKKNGLTKQVRTTMLPPLPDVIISALQYDASFSQISFHTT